MPSIEVLLSFTVAAFIMNISPGPSMLYVVARTLSQGIGAGLAAVAGLAAGGLIHVIAAVLGLAALISYSPLAYSILKTVGALYLVYLGIQCFRSAEGEHDAPKTLPRKSPGRIFRESVIVEVTNPKTGLFFLALLPQFVSVDAGSPTLQFLVLGLIVTLSAIPCDLLVTFSAHRIGHWLRDNPHAQRWQERLSGSILFGLGGYVLVSDSR